MRRKEGALLPIEEAILEAAVDRRRGDDEFYGFAIASEVAERAGRSLPAQGTLYKALCRMERAGLLQSRWEDPDIAQEAGRPRRRLYQVTGDGMRALSTARLAHSELPHGLRARTAPS